MRDDEVLVGQNEGQFVHAAGLLLGPIAPRQERSFWFQLVWYGERASFSLPFRSDCLLFVYIQSVTSRR
jgi:hypothetical protein